MDFEKTVTTEDTQAEVTEAAVSEEAVSEKTVSEEPVSDQNQFPLRQPARPRLQLLFQTEDTSAEEVTKEESEAGPDEETEAVSEPEKASSEEPAAKEEPAAVKPTAGAKAKNIIFTVIRIVLVAALIAAIVWYVFLRNQTSDTPAAVVFETVTKTVTTDKMEPTTDRYFKKYYGLNAADYEDVLYYAPVSNMDAEELLIVKLKNTDQAEAVTEAILKRQADKEQSFEGYAPEQYALAQQYILDVQGNYILFVIDPKAEEIDAAFAGTL